MTSDYSPTRRWLFAVCCWLLAVRAVAVDAAWDYLPLVGYDGEGLTVALRPAGGAADWHLSDERSAELPARLAEDGRVLTATVVPGEGQRLTLAKGGERIVLRLVHPGQGAGLALDAQRRLTQQGELAILVLPRLEIEADRRWAALRPLERVSEHPCGLTLAEPVVPWGEAALTAQLCASQSLQLRGQGLLVRLSGADRRAGWKHREYRQVLAWLVADALLRGATMVAVAEPIAPASEAAAISPLRVQARDVVQAYHGALIDTGALDRDAYWEIAPGVLGPGLNERGQAALAALIKPWLKP